MRGLGLYAALFGGVLLLLLVSVVLQDMALRSAFAVQAERDARSAASAIEQAVAIRLAAARGFQAVVADGADAQARRRLDALLPAIVGPTTPLFDRVVIRDAAGRVIQDTSLVAAADSIGRAVSGAVEAELASLDATAGAADRTRARSALHPLRSAPGLVALVVPFTVRDSLRGTFLGTVRTRALASQAVSEAAPRRLRLVVHAGPDTILQSGVVDDATTRTATVLAHVRGARPWQVDAIHEDTAPGVRATLWLLGSAALLFLVLGLARERRHAGHVADRSAELERLSAELLRSNRMKSEFLANVSHELRTPLNAIVGFVELLRDGVYGELSPRQTNPVERIAGSATHLRHLVDQVLDIAKMAAGRLEVHLEPVVLRPFVLNVASELESLAADKGIVLSLTVGSSLPRVKTDPSHLRQILVNLVGNAIKYTPTGGAVAIRTRLVGGPPGASWRVPTPPGPQPFAGARAHAPGRPGEEEAAPPTLAARSPDPTRPWVAVQVSDTGIGIAPADQERIFEEFEQVNAGPRGESMQRGTGLGLPISRRLARLLGGDVSVESDIGKGATFTLWLPVELAA